MAVLPPDNLTYPVHLTLGKRSSGSGFFFNTSLASYLITAKHVMFAGGLELYGETATSRSIASDHLTVVQLDLDLRRLSDDGNLKKHAKADVAVCKIASKDKPDEDLMSFVPGVSTTTVFPPGVRVIGLPITGTHDLAEAGVSNDVFVFGYPTSLGREAQLDKDRPLLRKGIIAGKTSDRRIVLDCPVYFGNSGGLAVEISYDQGAPTIHGIGIVTEMIPFVEELMSKQFNVVSGIRYENSGYSLVEPFDRIKELLDEDV